MRTPALIAKALGWPEERRSVAASGSQPPKLIVRRASPGRWLWIIGTWTGVGKLVTTSTDTPPLYGHAPTQPAALALGLAALDTASVRNRP